MFRVMAFSITILWTFILELLGMKVLVHRIPYQRIATGSMIWNLDMKLTEVEGINHLFELFEMNLDLMKHPECVLWSLLQLISLGCGLGGHVLSNPDHIQIRRGNEAYIDSSYDFGGPNTVY
eukprot:78668_1